jgi:hypothetical protein
MDVSEECEASVVRISEDIETLSRSVLVFLLVFKLYHLTFRRRNFLLNFSTFCI